jgi:acetyltransferase-like isoleucine patch superfamily enzyme
LLGHIRLTPPARATKIDRKLELDLDSPQTSAFSLFESEGEDHLIQIAPDVTVTARIIVRGCGNSLIIAPGASIAPFAPAGFAATVPDPSPTPYSLTIEGDDNTVLIGAGTRLATNLTVRGVGNRVEIGEACHLHGFINVLCSSARLAIGSRTTMVQGSIQLHEPGEIVFGEDCMISSQVYVSLSDIHPIYDTATGERINPAASVHVGNHVWAGLRCMILKGSRIGDGTIVAAGAIIAGETPSGVIVAGAPARILRRGVSWRRAFGELVEPQVTQATPGFWRRLFGRQT